MNNHDRVVKHLEFIQGVVNHLGGNSFLLKGWSMTVLVGGSLLMVRTRSDQPLLALTLLLPVSGFWILDAYFLWQERLFRAEYDRVRQEGGDRLCHEPDAAREQAREQQARNLLVRDPGEVLWN